MLDQYLIVSLARHVTFEYFLDFDTSPVLSLHEIILVDDLVGQDGIKLAQYLESSLLPVTLLSLEEVIGLALLVGWQVLELAQLLGPWRVLYGALLRQLGVLLQVDFTVREV